ncbi:MAG TPA: type II secretion system F family protein [Acidimicrobiia bacterium]
MSPASSVTVFAGLASGLAAGLAIYLLIPPPRSLQARVRPYVRPTVADVSTPIQGSALRRVFNPIVKQSAESLGRLIERQGKDATLVLIRQAGWYRGMADDDMLYAFRVAQLRSVLLGGLGAVAVGTVLGTSVIARIALAVLGLIIGATRQRGRVEKAIEARRELMRIEIYTVNQLLAMRVRAGGGVVHAVNATVGRGEGAVVDELSAAMRLQRSGWRAFDAFRRIAELTPEPYCARTYRLLASAEERGSDLAASLLALSEDVRETRRESIKRSATKRRAAMLLPTIAILAPVLIIFVAAPLPYLITGWQ